MKGTENPIIGGIIAFVGGAIISLVCYIITLSALKSKKPGAVTFISSGRTVLYVAYFAALYFFSGLLPWSCTELFIGGAAGIVISMIIFTKMLLAYIKKHPYKSKAEQLGKVDGDGGSV